MFSDDDLLPLSALQHLMFCERQWALIHLEQIWEENRLTVQGKCLHERVDTPEHESRGDIKIVRSLRLRSLKLGLTGIADVVEFHRSNTGNCAVPYPIEYKRGSPKKGLCDSVQLCAQALCLEEMLKVTIPKGAFFYGEIHRRLEVEFDAMLREQTIQLIQQLHSVANAQKTPPAKFEKKCLNCSLVN